VIAENDSEGLATLDILYGSIEETIEPSANRQVVRLPFNINDPEFAEAVVAAFESILPESPGKVD
jgi:uncharacterized protein (UPF0261 family)